MNAVRGRVRGGRIETEDALPEGAEVVVLTPSEEEPFDLDPGQVAELETRIADTERGEVEPGATVFGKLRQKR
jgi:hypothetical protein